MSVRFGPCRLPDWRFRAASARHGFVPRALGWPLAGTQIDFGSRALACRFSSIGARLPSSLSGPSHAPSLDAPALLCSRPIVASAEIENRIRWGKFEVTNRNAQRLYSSKIVKNTKEIQDDCMELFGHKAVRPSSRACARCEQVHAREGVARRGLLALSWCRRPRCVGVSAHGGGVHRGPLLAKVGRCRSCGKPLPRRPLVEEPLSQRFPADAGGPSVGVCPRPWL